MSEPVSNAEIEDVLSSIRRLVSGEVETSNIGEIDDVGKPEPVAKLILTADFRVSDPQNDKPAETEDTNGASESGIDFSDDMPLQFHHENHTSEYEEPSEEEFDTETKLHLTESDAVASDKPSLESTIAELEAAIAQQGGEWEPDGSSFEEDPDAEEVLSEPVHDWVDSTANEAEPIARAAIDENHGFTPVEDTVEADLFGGEESVIEEEALRDMVSDIVRQELQGALGERITRNVRKLVRREINRVLAAQDFE